MKNIKYYLCIKNFDAGYMPPELSASYNQFLFYAFNQQISPSYCFSNPREFYKDKIYKCFEGNLYSENSHCYSLESVQDNFTEIEFELDDDVKSVIKRKQLFGDFISIEPISLRNGKIIYDVVCHVHRKNFKFGVFYTQKFTSNPMKGIAECYKEARYRQDNVNFLKKLLNLKDKFGFM